jgi:hypothetical protein
MKLPRQLSREDMEQIISQIQAILWLDMSEDGELWNPDKEWDSETVENVAAVLADHGLRPSESFTPPPVKG